MTTASPLLNNTLASANVTTKSQEQSLYQNFSSPPPLPSLPLLPLPPCQALEVGVIVVFTVVLLILKAYNRHMRVRRELEPKGTKASMSTASGQGNSLAQHPTVTFIPVDIHMQNR
ncbi:Noncompact myelin-associated protein [Dryobates pubescens]|uniref:Noncompact myelin-associated protein n=1 Tax=Dryobates pubescens TaxID=118200 RepID=A0A093H0C3_DRYPU|nr:Noncompact myelin-associated protein [Dryobates pubescens]